MFDDLFQTNLDDKDLKTETNITDNLKRKDIGTFVGTPLYIAPEMLNENSSGPHSDLWALGVIIYELMTGRSPWKGTTN